MSADGFATVHFSAVDLTRYFDGSVPGTRAAEMERHLASCPACRSRVASMSGARRAVKLLPTPSVPDIVWRNVARRFQSAHRGSAPSANGASHPDPSARRTHENGTAGFIYNAGPSVFPTPAGRRDAPGVPGSLSVSGEREAYGWKMGAALGLAIAFVVVLIVSPLGGRIAEAVKPPATGIDYGMYVGGLTDGAVMERFETRYDRRRLAYPTSTAMADRLVGRELLDGPVDGLVARATYSLSDNGVRAVQRTYIGDDVRIDVFRQPADHPVVLDDLRPYQVRLAGVPCIASDTERYRLVTFTRGRERFVIVLNRPSSEWIRPESRAPALDALVAGLYHG